MTTTREELAKQLSVIASAYGVALTDIKTQMVPVYNVVGYDADPTGVSDSTSAILAAIAACQAAGGGIVFFPAGTYLVSSIIATSGLVAVYLLGAGKYASIIKYTQNNTVFNMGNLCGIEGMLIYPVTSGYGEAIANQSGATVYIRRVVISEAAIGINLVNSGEIYIEDTEVISCTGIGLNIANNNVEVYLDSVEFSSNIVNIEIDAAYGIHATKVDMGGGVEGILFRPGVGQKVLQGCFFDGCCLGDSTTDHGLYMAPNGGSISGVYFTNCRAASCAANNIQIYVISGTCSGIKFDGCGGVVGHASGFSIIGGDHITLSNCFASGNGQSGLDISAGATHIKILGGVYGPFDGFGANAGDGIYLDGSIGDYIEISEASCVGNTTAAISDNSSIAHKQIRNCNGYNPVGHLSSQPTIPNSGSAYTNATGLRCRVFIVANAGGTTAIAINGTATGVTVAASGYFSLELDPGETITLTYSSVPSWSWWGL
jgi:hypothetical protein